MQLRQRPASTTGDRKLIREKMTLEALSLALLCLALGREPQTVPVASSSLSLSLSLSLKDSSVEHQEPPSNRAIKTLKRDAQTQKTKGLSATLGPWAPTSRSLELTIGRMRSLHDQGYFKDLAKKPQKLERGDALLSSGLPSGFAKKLWRHMRTHDMT